MDRIPIVIQDRGTGNYKRYGWVSIDGRLYSSYETPQQADRATVQGCWHGLVDVMYTHREIVPLTRIE